MTLLRKKHFFYDSQIPSFGESGGYSSLCRALCQAASQVFWVFPPQQFGPFCFPSPLGLLLTAVHICFIFFFKCLPNMSLLLLSLSVFLFSLMCSWLLILFLDYFFFFNLFFILYWSIVDLQRYVSFRCTAKYGGSLKKIKILIEPTICSNIK